MIRIQNSYQRDSLNLLEEFQLSPEMLDMPQIGDLHKTSLDKIQKVNAAYTAVSLEVILFHFTKSSFQAVASVIKARMVKCTATAGVASVADGPFPVGEVVGGILLAGGAIWSTWDVWKAVQASKNLPDNLTAIMQEQLEQMHDSTLEILQFHSQQIQLLINAPTL